MTENRSESARNAMIVPEIAAIWPMRKSLRRGLSSWVEGRCEREANSSSALRFLAVNADWAWRGGSLGQKKGKWLTGQAWRCTGRPATATSVSPARVRNSFRPSVL